MSTKASIVWSEDIHFYRELRDDEHLYLQFKNSKYLDPLIVKIPLDIWEVIRQFPGCQFLWADKTDEEIKEFVEKELAEAIKEYESEKDKDKPYIIWLACIYDGDIRVNTKEELTTQGIARYSKLRSWEQNLKKAMAKHKTLNDIQYGE